MVLGTLGAQEGSTLGTGTVQGNALHPKLCVGCPVITDLTLGTPLLISSGLAFPGFSAWESPSFKTKTKQISTSQRNVRPVC